MQLVSMSIEFKLKLMIPLIWMPLIRCHDILKKITLKISSQAQSKSLSQVRVCVLSLYISLTVPLRLGLLETEYFHGWEYALTCEKYV